MSFSEYINIHTFPSKGLSPAFLPGLLGVDLFAVVPLLAVDLTPVGALTGAFVVALVVVGLGAGFLVVVLTSIADRDLGDPAKSTSVELF